MIIFNPSKLEIKRVHIKSISTAMGGVITYVDDDVVKKIHISQSIARSFIKYYGLSSFWTPKLGYILFYEDQIISVEVATPGTDSVLAINLKRVNDIVSITTDDLWYFDCSYLYTFKNDFISLGFNNFLVQPVNAIPLAQLGFELGVHQETRYCVGYQAPHILIMSPPIWKNFDTSSIKDIGLPSDFDKFNDEYFININFVIYAGKKLVEIFDYSVIDPLMLPELIIDMRTINLDALPSEVKYITPIHMEFKDAFAWLLGLLSKTTSLKEVLVIRSIIRYLVSNCCTRKEQIENLFYEMD